MSWNTDLFLLLNAPTYPDAVTLLVAEALAAAPALLAPARLAVAAGLFAGQALNMLLGMAWYEPRPFIAGVGHTWMAHIADNGFPSDHATLAWSLGLGLVLTGASRCWGVAACLLGVVTGWARIYLGVHFPLDVLASAPVGLLAATAACLAVPAVRAWIAPYIERLYEAVLGRLPTHLPLPRRVRS